MAIALVPHSVTAPGTIRVWVGIADHDHKPRISWRLHRAVESLELAFERLEVE